MAGIRDKRMPRVEYAGALEDRLKTMELRVRQGLELEFCRLLVPVGEEGFNSDRLQLHYKRELSKAIGQGKILESDFEKGIFERSHNHFTVSPNSLLTPCFTFGGSQHDSYKQMFRWPGPSASTKKILIADSGIASGDGFNIAAQKNFVDWGLLNQAKDDHPQQHGTCIAEIIRDLCPQALLEVYKVVDSRNRASEWDTMAALIADCGAQVINLSLAFGLQDQKCAYCGRESHGSRSAVFENIINQITRNHDIIIVGAAGNQGKTELAYPARFSKVLAVGAINLCKSLAKYSNHSENDHQGGRHNRVFVLPGGERDLAEGAIPTEWVGTSNGNNICGTSFAAAYATAIIAHLWSKPQHVRKNSEQMIDYLAMNADKQSIPHYQYFDHGQGLMLAV